MITRNSVHASDKAHLNHTDAFIYSMLSDLSSYSAWWPMAKIIKIDDNNFEVSTLGPGSFTWTIAETIENKKIVLTYDGIFSGHGTWNIENEGAMTHLTYSVSLNIEHVFYKFINKFIPITKLHSKMMTTVFRKLNDYLNNYHIES